MVGDSAVPAELLGAAKKYSGFAIDTIQPLKFA